MFTSENFDQLRLELSIKAKNGADFLLAASLVWLLIAYIWSLDQSAHTKSIYTFIVGAVMLPLARLLSIPMKTDWTVKGNPLGPLGLWLNFAQLFYFPFLFFVLSRMPESFVMVYAIITGAHFFPYAWYYKTPLFAVFAGVISVGALFMGLRLPAESMFWLPLSLSATLLILSLLLLADSRKKANAQRGKLAVEVE